MPKFKNMKLYLLISSEKEYIMRNGIVRVTSWTGEKKTLYFITVFNKN